MMKKVVIDTSVFIDYERACLGSYEDLLVLRKKGECELYVPTIVVVELWAGGQMRHKRTQKIAEKMLIGVISIDLDEKIAKLTGELIRKKVVGVFDAVVAASTLYLDAQLATGNKKHFEKVEGLRLFES